MKNIGLILAVFMHILFLNILISCSKKDKQTDPAPQIIVADSTFQISSVAKVDLNDFDIFYQIQPPSGEAYSKVFLQWSTNIDFSNRDSVILATTVSNQQSGHFTLRRLKQMSKYFVRLSIEYKNKLFLSQSKQLTTDTLIFIETPQFIEGGKSVVLKTNFKRISAASDTSTRVYLDNIPCSILYTNGESTNFTFPILLQNKKYRLRFERNGISVQTPDSLNVLKGTYSEVTPPVFPPSYYYNEPNALGRYGTCYSQDKGYVLGGAYYKMVQNGTEWQAPTYILEFDAKTKMWAKKNMPSPKYFNDPLCHYYNNSIYVVGGIEREWGSGYKDHIRNMLKLDLGTMQWSAMDTLPFAPMEQQVTFELNGEWYVGLGAKFTSHLSSFTTPMKEFWKYNPQSNIWTRIADFPGQWQGYPTAFELNNKGYVFLGAIPPPGDPFGYYSTTFTREFWEYNPNTNSWRQISMQEDQGPEAGEKYCIATNNGKAYFFTGQKREAFSYYYGFVVSEAYLEFDPNSNTFSRFSRNIPGEAIVKVVYQKNGIIFLHGDQFGYTESVSNKTYELKLE